MSATLLTAALLLTVQPARAGVEISSEDSLLDFSFGWSAEAAAVPALDRRFRIDAARQKSAALVTAREDREARKAMTGDWNGHFFSRQWSTAGQTVRLLSLEAETGTFTGGAHGNSGTSSLLWDRKLARELRIDDLLRRAGWWNGAIRQPFCVLLDRERAKRRQEPVDRSDMFGECPELKELTLTLEDSDGNGRLDHVRVTADQYVAGPYAEGEYVISLPLTAAMLARLKPEYRASFEPQPPVQ
ncbi:hypothetical protein [Sphingomonas arenae]|uniref:hypothetical protein n=1 Tax=Sphingomonas arenae TaxID=2812555 RepID=UPI0019683A26|nr:hypothetical protein [Sphingomonas arenae]